jgi:hypothetical protein
VKRHWYFVHVYECPQCGSVNKWIVRRYTPKPVAVSERRVHRWVPCDLCHYADFG